MKEDSSSETVIQNNVVLNGCVYVSVCMCVYLTDMNGGNNT